MNEIELSFPISAGDQAHLAAASREPAHYAALLRRIAEQQASTKALLTAGERTDLESVPPVIRPLRLVPAPRSAPEADRGYGRTGTDQ